MQLTGTLVWYHFHGSMYEWTRILVIDNQLWILPSRVKWFAKYLTSREWPLASKKKEKLIINSLLIVSLFSFNFNQCSGCFSDMEMIALCHFATVMEFFLFSWLWHCASVILLFMYKLSPHGNFWVHFKCTLYNFFNRYSHISNVVCEIQVQSQHNEVLQQEKQLSTELT